MKTPRRKAGKALAICRLVALIMIGASVVFGSLFMRPAPIEAQHAAKSTAEYTLKLNGSISPALAGTIVAISDGLFLRQGLRVHLTSGLGDDDAIRSVATDESIVGIASAAGFLKARSEGLPIVAFAASYTVSSAEFFVLPGTTLHTASDLEGKRIGYRPGPEFATILSEFIGKNSLAQSQLGLSESQTPVQDLLDRKIDVMLGHRDIEGLELDRSNVTYQTLSPDSYGVHSAGPLYFAQERAFARSRNLQKLLIATADGWNAAYADQDGAALIIARSIDPPLSRSVITHVMDAQRRFLRPFGTRFGEIDLRRLRSLQAQLLLRRIIREPVDLNRAIDYEVLKEAYRNEASKQDRSER